MMKDPEFIADAAKSKLDLCPLGEEDLEKRCWKPMTPNRMWWPS
jgi:hypothetical protein